ncbi:MAG: prepilin-type N-terminal cleavage/methylation domain-containing protein [Pseudomonadota bacterium]
MAPNDNPRRKAGFTLIEALVALSLLLTFVATLGPVMFQARHILTQSGDDIGAQILLRGLLAEPFDRVKPETGVRAGERSALAWSLDVEPYGAPHALASDNPKQREPAWALFKVVARVTLGNGRAVTAETLRLGRTE